MKKIFCAGMFLLKVSIVFAADQEIDYGASKVHGHLDSGLGHDYTEMIKIELICHDEEVDTIKKAIIENARTEYKGDGIVVVSPVEEATSIRTGQLL